MKEKNIWLLKIINPSTDYALTIYENGLVYGKEYNEKLFILNNETIDEIKNSTEDLIFTNLVDFDMLYGHRNNIDGYARALEEFDSRLPEIMDIMTDEDILVLTADHGNDPSTPSTDHDREYIPILAFGKSLKNNVDIGVRESYADISATILDLMDLPRLENGKSFKNEIV